MMHYFKSMYAHSSAMPSWIKCIYVFLDNNGSTNKKFWVGLWICYNMEFLIMTGQTKIDVHT